MKLAVIIVAAGNSQRMGFDKLLADLNGKPVIQHSIETFLHCPEVSEVIVVCPQSRYDQLTLNPEGKSILRVDGGNDRHDSVAAGLSAISDKVDYIAVHDGARPLITDKQIRNVLEAAVEHGAATSARLVTETVKRANSDGMVHAAVNRDNLWLMETPQIFLSNLLIDAYTQVTQSGARVTDEVSAMELINHPVKLVANATTNLKITYPADIKQAIKLL